MNTRPVSCVRCIVSAVVACTTFATFAMFAEAAQTAEPVVIDGVPHVMNPAVPRDGVRELQLTELWRRGGEDDEEVLLGMVTSVLTDSQGNVYALDSQLSEVLVFDPQGRLLRTLGRRGQGPGEFENAAGITFLPGAGALGVTQTFPGKLVGINLDGTPAGDIRIGGDPAAGGFVSVIGAYLGGDNLVIIGAESSINLEEMYQDVRFFVRSIESDGALRHEYHTHKERFSFSGVFTLKEAQEDYVWSRTAVDSEGRVLIGLPREEYRISVFGTDGELAMVFGRAYQSWPRSPELLARSERMYEIRKRHMPPGSRIELAKNEADLWGIKCLPDGTTWVTTSSGMYEPPPGVFAVWDVFDDSGVFVKQVQARIPGKPGTDMMLVTEHGYAVLITGFWEARLSAMGAAGDGDGDDAEAMQIICYRIES